MGKNRSFEIGGTKNQNKCSVFRAAYKLLHLHTNLIFKYSIQNLQNTTKSPFFHHPIQKSKYRTQYRQTQLKSTLSPISNHNQKSQSKPLSSYINTKILRKIPTFTDYQLFIKNHINNIKKSNLFPIQKENI